MEHWFSLNRSTLEQALRMTVACVAAFALAAVFGQAQGFWAVITALFVTQSNVGGSLKAAVDRFVGSLLGVVYGCAVAIAIPHSGVVAQAAALALAVAPLAFLAARTPAYRIAPITAIIMLLATSTTLGANLGPLGVATDRIIEVAVGCTVGILVSLLVLPSRASQSVRETAGEIARLLADQMDAIAVPGDHSEDSAALSARMHRTLAQLEKLAGEAAHERQSRLTDMHDPAPLMRALVRLQHDVFMLRRAVGESNDQALPGEAAERWQSAARTGARALRHLADALTAGSVPSTPSDTMVDVVNAYQTAVDHMVEAPQSNHLPNEEVWRLFGTSFVFEQFHRDLNDLVERAAELAGRR